MTFEEKYLLVVEKINEEYDENFDYDIELVDIGNRDDIYDFGVDCGENMALFSLMKFIRRLESNEKSNI